MDDEKRQDASRGSPDVGKDIKRMELLMWHFNAAEVDRLIKCQLRYRQRLDALDLPVDLYRLRFARWLVEQGKLTEDIDSEPDASDKTSTDDDDPGHTRNANLSLKYMPAPYWYARPRPQSAQTYHSDRWRRSLSQLMVRLHREITRSSVNARIVSWP